MEPSITCGEYGCPDAERWSAPFVARPEDEARLHALEGAKLLEIDRSAGGLLRVAGRSHCGRIRLPSGRSLELGSKVPPVSIIEWLVFTDTLPTLDDWTETPSIAPGGGPADALAALYVLELTRVTRFHWRAGHVATLAVKPTVRGRVDATRLGRIAARLPSLPCRYRDRTMDTMANRVLARALDAVWRISGGDGLSQESRRTLDWLRRQWSDIDRDLMDLDHAVAQAVASPPLGYRRGLRLARLLLRGGSADAVYGDGGDLFLINMSAIWEKGLRRILSEWAQDKKIRVASQEERTRPWADSYGAETSRWLTADALLCAPRPIVFDAKYKRDFGRETREDRFQITAYAMAFAASAAVLTYPTATDRTDLRVLLRSQLPGAESTVISLDLPMSLGPEVCAKMAGAHLTEICAAGVTR